MAETTNVLKALAENNVLQMVMFNDDSIEVQFKNHSFLLLSPCGANYQYHPPTRDGLKLVDSINTIRQRSKFATSETKAQVDIAMKARNLFATRPYLAAEFTHLCDGVVHLHQDVLEYVWPEIDDNQAGSSITQDQNGDILVVANNDLAQLTLHPTQNQVEVKFLVKVTEKTKPKTVNTEVTSRQYCWVKQIFSASCCPERWKYPLALALDLKNDNKTKHHHDILNKVLAVKALPDNCPKPFTHQWRANTEIVDENSSNETSNLAAPLPHKRIKMLLFDGSIYWFFQNQLNIGNNDIEVWLHDGSLLTGTSSRFHFTYKEYVKDEQNREVVSKERMFTSTALPMNEKLKNVILRVMRLCSNDKNLKSTVDETINIVTCWMDGGQSSNKENFPQSVNAVYDPVSCDDELNPTGHVVVPNLGMFSAANGSIQVCFDDESTVHAALSPSDWKMLQRSSQNLSLIAGRILLPNKRYHVCSNILNCDPQLFFYMKHVCEWLLWLVSDTQSRGDFYQNTIYCREQTNMVLKEIEKISKFNSHSSESAREMTQTLDLLQISKQVPQPYQMHCGAITPVASALQKTGKAIDDISSFIENIRKL